jgi:hypothetical protein
MGSRPRTQSAVKETAECAMLASGTAAGFMHSPCSPLYSGEVLAQLVCKGRLTRSHLRHRAPGALRFQK